MAIIITIKIVTWIYQQQKQLQWNKNDIIERNKNIK